MPTFPLKLTDMAHGGSALGRDRNGRTIFVRYAIPGETITVQVDGERAGKKGFSRGELIDIRQPSPDRVAPTCPHFGRCGGCHLQHMAYPAQLRAKRAVVQDQLQRLGGFKQIDIQPTLPHPQPYGYRYEMVLSPTAEGKLGYWFPGERAVRPIDTCPIMQPRLLELLQDIDLELPGLRKLSLRLGDDDALLAALEVDDVEPPQLETDFPLSVAIVLPDNTAASLVGDFYTVQQVKGRDFRVSSGIYLYPSPVMAGAMIDTVLAYAADSTNVLEIHSGAGVITAFLAQMATNVAAVEVNPDAVADAAVNLDDTENVLLYEGMAEDVLPHLEGTPDVVVVHPGGDGLSLPLLKAVTEVRAPHLIYVSQEIATLARDGKQLARRGYELIQVQPIDMEPQTFHVETVSLWQKREA